MRKTILMTALIGATLAAVPAAAQPGYDRGYGYSNNGYSNGYDRGYEGNYRNGAGRELWQLSQRVDQGVRQGDLTRREADYFRREIAQLRYLDQRYGNGGYDWREQRQLDQRIDRLRQRLQFERRDDDRRWDDNRRW